MAVKVYGGGPYNGADSVQGLVIYIYKAKPPHLHV